MPKKRIAKPRGLGDVIENITTATGIKKAVDLFSEVTGIDCGCDARKEKLNKMFKFEVNCLTKDEYEQLSNLLKKGAFTNQDNRTFTAIYNRVLNRKDDVTYCQSCLIDRVKKMRKLLKEYQDELNNI